MLMLTRSFYGLQSNWVPTSIALGALLLNALLDAVFFRVGAWGIPLATALVNIAGATTLFVILRRRVGLPSPRRTGASVARICLAAALAALASLAVWYPLDRILGRSLGAQIVSLGLALAAGLGVYLGTCRALRVRELRALLPLLRRSSDLG
jgi:peptidoglycan biosynthesis protein MviN/MurJ (putative lipid II flippase)